MFNLILNVCDVIDLGGIVLIWIEDVLLIKVWFFNVYDLISFVCILVDDNGCGMLVEMLKCVFELFFMIKLVGWGIGFGFFIVYLCILKFDGCVLIESCFGEGMVIYLDLFIVNVFIELWSVLSMEVEFDWWEELGGYEMLFVCDDDEIVFFLFLSLLGCFGYMVIGV